MSSVTKKKYTVVLYQAGLGKDHSYFNRTFQKIKALGSKHIAFKENNKTIENTFIDMSKYDTDKGYFYGLNSSGDDGKSTILENNFNNIICEIIDTLKANPNKILHIKTNLTNGVDYDDGFDSIEHQKKKLELIIKTIQSYDIVVKVNLVGHSQGGLVNIETAIDMPRAIEKIVSISTPYSPVTVAKNLLYIDRLLKKIKIGGLLVADDEESTKRYENSANILTSSDYYNDIKKRWDGLKYRPKLMVITGTSGHVSRQVCEYVDYGVPPFNSSIRLNFERKYSFDGLVLTSERKAISHDYEVNFADQNLPCYNKQTFTNKNCGATIYDRCINCSAPYFNAFCSVFYIAMDAIKGTNALNNNIVKAIIEGVSRSNVTNVSYKNYYDIYSSDFSHMYLAQYDGTIATIVGFVE